MVQVRRFSVALVVAALLVGCPGPGIPLVTPLTRSPKPAVLPGQTPTPDAPATPDRPILLGTPQPTLGTTPAPLVAATTGALVGLVRLPSSILAGVPGVVSNHGASIIANHGGGLISNNGGGIISDQGGAYRLQALAASAQDLLVGGTVVLCDAAGVPVPNPAGGIYSTGTDATGRYAFAALPALPRNATLRIELPGETGTLTAFVPRTPAANTAIDIDLVSTLATTYILDRYVKGQADPALTYDRLPTDVEAKTREVAAAALASPPLKLDTASVVAAIDGLRRTDPALDTQLETVRRLLLLAGQTDGGAGRPALSVTFRGIQNLDVGPAGELYVASTTDRRVYRVDAANNLRVVAGTGLAHASLADQTGKSALQADLGLVVRVLVEPAGGLWVLDSLIDGSRLIGRLSRIGTDGVVKELWRETNTAGYHPGLALYPDGDGAVWLLTRTGEVLHLDAAGTKSTAATLSGSPGFTGVLLQLADGRLVRDLYKDGSSKLVSYASPAFTTPTDLLAHNAFAETLSQDMHGSLYLAAGGAAFHVDTLAPDGTRRVLLGTRPTGLPEGAIGAVAADAGGRLYLGLADVVYRVENGVATRFAGGGASSSGGIATDQALQAPYGIALMSGGGYAIGDFKAIFRTDSAGTIRKLIDLPWAARELAAGPDDTVYALVARSVLAVKPDGTSTTLIDYGSAGSIGGLRRDPDGALLFGRLMSSGNTSSIERLVPGEATTTRLVTGFKAMSGFDRGPDGSLYLLTQTALSDSQPKLLRVPVTGCEPEVLSTDTRFAEAQLSSGAGIAVDVQGRVVFSAHPTYLAAPVITRWDPVANTFTALTGASGRAFKGVDSDDSLGMIADLDFEPNGDLSFVDTDRRQARRLSAATLAD